jgi:hypothetical protein
VACTVAGCVAYRNLGKVLDLLDEAEAYAVGEKLVPCEHVEQIIAGDRTLCVTCCEEMSAPWSPDTSAWRGIERGTSDVKLSGVAVADDADIGEDMASLTAYTDAATPKGHRQK